MKGVIVQIGEPKSIVLYNSGKIGAIPTPAECHVGMVVTVKLNDRLKILAILLAAALLVALGVFIGVFLRGSGAAPLVQNKAGNITPVPEHDAPETPMHESGRGRMMMTPRRGSAIPTVTVQEALELPDDTFVTLTGNLAENLGDERYIFRDATGDIIVEIDRKLCRNMTLTSTDTVEITGEIDAEKRRIIIDVKTIRKR